MTKSLLFIDALESIIIITIIIISCLCEFVFATSSLHSLHYSFFLSLKYDILILIFKHLIFFSLIQKGGTYVLENYWNYSYGVFVNIPNFVLNETENATQPDG